MPLKMLGVRIPLDLYKYIQIKAVHTGKEKQVLVAEIIKFYQEHDQDFDKKIKPLIDSHGGNKC